ncbi:MAG TPA: DUF6544 family protein [Gemmatimonadaceae bacterium]|nr:DUF6544 family protein [Gemmatimonadaceae bacterium]
MRQALRRGMTVGGTIVGGFALAVAVAAITANVRWGRVTTRKVRLLAPPDSDGAAAGAGRYSTAELAGLPAPVRRYFIYALTPGQRLVRSARVEQEGEFAQRAGTWDRFTATEHFAVRPPGFVWDATIRMMPLLGVRVRDSYVDGVGTVDARVAGAMPAAHLHGTREVAEAALQRYLAEAVWLPTALLPSAGVGWTGIDDASARATITDQGLAVSVTFHFGADGEIVGTSAERYRDVSGAPEPTPWVGRFWDYERIHRMMVPRRGEVAWVLGGERVPYWRGAVRDVAYQPAP